MSTIRSAIRNRAAKLHQAAYEDAGESKGIYPWLREKMIARLNVVELQMNLGHRMILDLRSEEQLAAFRARDWEGADLQTCLDLLPEDGIALDIGAHVGLYSCPLGAHLRKGNGKLYAFEPIATNFKRLLENIKLNNLQKNVLPYKLALGSRSGTLEMRLRSGSPTNNAVGSNMFGEQDQKTVDEQKWPSECVERTSLDDWVETEQLQRCDLIKIDIEGADLDVLRAGKHLIQLFRPIIIAEFNSYWMKQVGQNFSDVVEFFSPQNYLIGPIDDHVPTKEGEVANYLLMPRERNSA